MLSEDKKMKVCFIGDAGHVNLVAWVRYLANRIGDKVHILSFNKPCEEVIGMCVHKLSAPLVCKKFRYFSAVPQVRRKLMQIRPDILIGYRINSYGFLSIMTGFHPVALIAQGSDIFYPTDSWIHKAFLHYLIKKSDLIHVWASHMENKLLESGAAKNKIFVLPKGVDIDLFRASSNRKPKKPFSLISTRQLRKSYNHHYILNALPVVLKKIPKLEYLICGEGEYRARLEELARNLGVQEHVNFKGRLKHHMLPHFLGTSDIYLSMQCSDGVSASLLEAMACGVFPIVTDIEANRLWIEDGVNGFLVPPDDHITLAQKIILAYEDSKLRKDAQAMNIALVKEKASIAKNTEQTLAIYSKLIDEFRRGKRCG
jgi:glycosyltransferase involved in cell wall biosynthesis